MKRRVGSRADVAREVLPAVGVLPDDPVAVDDGRREARDAGLRAQRVEIIAEQVVDRVLGRVLRMRWYANQQQRQRR